MLNMKNNNIKTHPCLIHADELSEICNPLRKIDITYFGYAHINKQSEFSVFNNHANFLEHYLNNRYYNADIHLANLNEFNSYLVLDAIELTKQSKIINEDAVNFGIKHIFSIFEKDETGTHCYHFANNSASHAINQFYINNVDLLKLFIHYFHDCINNSKQLKKSYDEKFIIDDNPLGFSTNNPAIPLDQLEQRNQFLRKLSNYNKKLPKIILPSQQEKCVKLLVEGLSAKQISDRLNLSRRTVENYLAKIRQLLGFRNSKEIILYYKHNFAISRNGYDEK